MKNIYTTDFLAFETSMLCALSQDRAEDPFILSQISENLCRLRRYKEAVKIDRYLVRKHPKDPVFRYNLACSYTHLKRYDRALKELDKAFKCGFKDSEYLLKDSDMKRLVEKHGKALCELLKKFNEV